jgi:hypothetical protein
MARRLPREPRREMPTIQVKPLSYSLLAQTRLIPLPALWLKRLRCALIQSSHRVLRGAEWRCGRKVARVEVSTMCTGD